MMSPIDDTRRDDTVAREFHVLPLASRGLRHVGAVLLMILVSCLVLVSRRVQGAPADPAAELARFSDSIAPVLTAKCVACHRPENKKGGLDLTTRETMLQGGETGPGFVPGQSDESPIYRRAISQDGQPPEMPEKGEPLTAAEAQQLGEWITAGAHWPDRLVLRETARADGNFWSFQPLGIVDPPEVADAAWTKEPIDRLVLARLRERHLAPNPPADPRTFIRRATFDLTGLPPTPEEVEAFVRDCQEGSASGAQGSSHRLQAASPLPDAACERLLDRLLASPHYGEHWGRHWLDVIRFGESRGYERNEIITNLWPFRDYVIRSFNEDKPFDRLVLEHLAGDVIGAGQPDIEIGSAFLVAGPYDDVGNQDPVAAAQIRADQMDEMIRATSEAFLGVTLGCARCHDHKFDPLTSRDYYSLYATFAGTFHGPREVATATERQTRSERLRPLEAERDRIAAQIETLERQRVARAAELAETAARDWVRPRHSRYRTEEHFPPIEARFVRLLVDGTDSHDPKHKQFKLDEFEVWTDEPAPRNVALASLGAMAEGAAPDAKDFSGAYAAALAIDGKFGERWHAQGHELLIRLAQAERIQRIVFSSDRTRALAEDHPLTVGVGDYRIEVSMDGARWMQVASSADRVPATELLQQARLRRLAATADETARWDALHAEQALVAAQLAQIPPLSSWWVGTHREAAGPFHVFRGGSPQKPGEEVTAASLRVLQHLPSSYQLEATRNEPDRRIALARWLTARDNPLTPRVLANRVWHYHFGQGIVDTPSDFGYLGGRPTHPELLDWLARELLNNDWKWKPLHRRIMLSQTYRQSGQWRESAAREDAGSRTLWRFPPRRLSAEEIRDTLLSVAGQLDRTAGGPGFRLYEYQQDNVATYVPLNTHGRETYRRAVYHHNARAARVDVMTDFDCPDPAFAEPRRATTTTPLQALTLLNHSFSLDMARHLAERLPREASGSAAQVRRAFQLAYARDPSDPELAAAVQLIDAFGLRAFCRALLNSNELIQIQ